MVSSSTASVSQLVSRQTEKLNCSCRIAAVLRLRWLQFAVTAKRAGCTGLGNRPLLIGRWQTVTSPAAKWVALIDSFQVRSSGYVWSLSIANILSRYLSLYSLCLLPTMVSYTVLRVWSKNFRNSPRPLQYTSESTVDFYPR